MPKQEFTIMAARMARLVVLTATVLLAGCAMSDEKLAGMLVAPGKFRLYTCPELATKATELAKQQQELEALMAKAGDGATGKLVSTMAYRTDYLSGQGEMKDVREAQTEKNCDASGADAIGARNAAGAATSPAGGQARKPSIQH